MISEQRKKELINAYMQEPEGDWIQLLPPKEKRMVYTWQYEYYSGQYKIIGAILEQLQNQLDELSEFDKKV